MAAKTTPPKAAAKSAKSPAAEGNAPATKAAGAETATPPAKSATPVTVTTKHLAAELMERHDLPRKQAESLLTDVFERLVEHLKAGERVRIGGLGIIEVKDRAARMGRNPATGAPIEIKASRKIAFRAAKELKDAI